MGASVGRSPHARATSRTIATTRPNASEPNWRHPFNCGEPLLGGGRHSVQRTRHTALDPIPLEPDNDATADARRVFRRWTVLVSGWQLGHSSHTTSGRQKTMTAFVPAGALKQSYRVVGEFYSLRVTGADPVTCRSVLEISSTGTSEHAHADAVFVMMNPGSSRPVEEADPILERRRGWETAPGLVPTVPDTTQYQVMRVMHYSGWDRVRVINLSDLRESKSGTFIKRYRWLEGQAHCTAHSVFAAARSTELQGYLARKPGGPIVCAWGVSDDLDPLIQQALKALGPEAGVTGVPKPGCPGRYFHPLPTLQVQKEQWVTQMLATLRA